MSNSWSTNTQKIGANKDEGVYVENPEFVYVKTDAEGAILWAIKKMAVSIMEQVFSKID